MGKAKKATGKTMSKSEIFDAVANSCGIKKKEAMGVLTAMTEHGYATLKKTGLFIYPGFAKFRVTKKKAKAKRFGKNPFTQEMQWFKAKPASKNVRARPIKVCKDCVA
jgi:nucleoid DNA-binding protein